MFARNTVFVLGAGASWHYGYPTGEELVRRVREKAEYIITKYNSRRANIRARDDVSCYPRFAKADHPDKSRTNLDAFLERIKSVEKLIDRARPLVIDDFLGLNKDIQDIGKMLIAMVLHDCEQRETIRPKESSDWIRFITHQLTVLDPSTYNQKHNQKLLDNKVTFVTFNYDISLEKRLYKALSSYQYYSEGGQLKDFFSPNRFLHIYGKLREFDTANPEPVMPGVDSVFPLTAEIDYAFNAAKHIRTIAPAKMEEDTPETEAAKRAISEAEYIYCLGYGFDLRNNDLLRLGKRSSDDTRIQHIYFTNYNNHNNINKRLANLLKHPEDDLMGERYISKPPPGRQYNRYYCQKSIKNVYDALAEDFEFPD